MMSSFLRLEVHFCQMPSHNHCMFYVPVLCYPKITPMAARLPATSTLPPFEPDQTKNSPKRSKGARMRPTKTTTARYET